jgi:hypothetical protein
MKPVTDLLTELTAIHTELEIVLVEYLKLYELAAEIASIPAGAAVGRFDFVLRARGIVAQIADRMQRCPPIWWRLKALQEDIAKLQRRRGEAE